ncbi:MAG TPA: DUF3175 domain-containing protein [Gemmatimonadaceae bacterium]
MPTKSRHAARKSSARGAKHAAAKHAAAKHAIKSTSKRGAHRWSGRVTRTSNALDLDRSVFTWKDPHRIALSLKHSAEHSNRRKSDPYRSAMSMLTFYINRAGSNLTAGQRKVLEHAKDELRRVFDRE